MLLSPFPLVCIGFRGYPKPYNAVFPLQLRFWGLENHVNCNSPCACVCVGGGGQVFRGSLILVMQKSIYFQKPSLTVLYVKQLKQIVFDKDKKKIVSGLNKSGNVGFF